MYDFNKVINRIGTNCAKYDDEKVYQDDKMISLWVADMDFEVLPEIKEALQKVVDQNIYGYTNMTDEYYNCVISWLKDRHDFAVEKDWIVTAQGVIAGLRLAIQAYSEENDAVLIMKPVYYPFDRSINLTNRKVIECPLVLEDNKYVCDFDLFEQLIIDNDVKIFILCNPHNPLGKVWTKEELQKIGDICKKHHVYVVSDEIHMDFIHPGSKHIPFYEVDESFKEFSMICTSPSKTFNIAGIQVANMIIADEKMREKFEKRKSMSGIGTPNMFAIAALQAAYTYGKQWVDELNDYIYHNYLYFKQYLEENLPELKLIEAEGLYLIWVDMSSLNMNDKELEEFMLNKAHLWLDEGYIFGTGGSGFERFNIACPRSVLEKALNQLNKAIKERKV